MLYLRWSLDDPAIKQAIKEAHEFYDNDDDEEDDPGSDEWLLPICFAIDVYIEFMDVWRKNHEQNIILCDSPCLQKYNHTPVTFPRDPETRGYNRNGQYNVFAVTRFVGFFDEVRVDEYLYPRTPTARKGGIVATP